MTADVTGTNLSRSIWSFEEIYFRLVLGDAMKMKKEQPLIIYMGLVPSFSSYLDNNHSLMEIILSKVTIVCDVYFPKNTRASQAMILRKLFFIFRL